MTERPLTELGVELANLNWRYTGRELRHVKTGSFYRVTGFHYRESTMELMFTYRTIGSDGVVFSRPLAELTDGRFEVFGK
jgi:hypothetical protein